MTAHVDTEKLFAGDTLSLARAISEVENDGPDALRLLYEVFPRTGRCTRIGVTGPPGAGKSTITNRLARLYRSRGLQVGIIAVDPTSPFTGGALLGDRVRMSDLELDTGVFIRSMASRGSLGGLSRKTMEAADILDASGRDVVIMETVGVGQSELDVAGAADSTIVVLVPESGDSVQAMKAGLMEIADLFVLNKADRAGADQAVMAIQTILHFRQTGTRTPPVLKTVASEGVGIEELLCALDDHRRDLETTGGLHERRLRRMERRVRELVAEQLRTDFWTPDRLARLKSGLARVAGRLLTPYDLCQELLRE